jgi:protein-L-isoaspartate O-methyltransferase
MKKAYFLVILIIFIGISGVGQRLAEPYSFKTGDIEGTGKWYFGREIAPVMSHYGIGWLERSEREREEQVSLLLKNMDIKLGDKVADIGAGSGYHVVRMAPMVGTTGKVFAVDIQQEMLDYIAKRTKKLKLTHVETILGENKNARLPAESIDKILMVDVYHEFEFPQEMGRSLFEALRPGGFLFLIEYRAEDPDVPIKPVHKMTEVQCKKEIEGMGFTFVKNITNLPWQHCLIFTKPLK